MTMVLPWVLFSSLQKREDVVGRGAVEIAGRLIADDDRRIGDDGARDRDALLLSAGELARLVLRPIGKAHDLERDPHVFLALGARKRREQQRKSDVPLGRQLGIRL